MSLDRIDREPAASGFRRWWRPPRRLVDREPDRKVTFLELFYDLAFVVLISRVAHYLTGHIGVEGLVHSSLLFALLWLAWVNGTLYHDLHGNNEDVRTRVFTFLQMTCVAAMAIFAHDAFGEGGGGFALSFASLQLILALLWWSTGQSDPVHRPLSTPYALCHGLTAALFVASAVAPVEARLAMWGAGLAVGILAPLANALRPLSDPEVLLERKRSETVTPSLVERFGLLTIVVLGEVLLGVVDGASEAHPLSVELGVAFGLGLLVAVGLWWLYFDLIAHHVPIHGGRHRVWLYLHLPLTAGIMATGGALHTLLEHTGGALPAEKRWLVVGAVALALASIAGLLWTLTTAREHHRIIRVVATLLVGSSLGILALGWTALGAVELLLALDVLLMVPAVASLVIWITVFGGEEVAID